MRLRNFETRLGLALATRTAHPLSLTPEGERFAHEAELLLQQLESLPETFQRDDQPLTRTGCRRCPAICWRMHASASAKTMRDGHRRAELEPLARGDAGLTQVPVGLLVSIYLLWIKERLAWFIFAPA
ncbi:hypothetical protein CS8_056980 [Cupriavidus sp. 8B]